MCVCVCVCVWRVCVACVCGVCVEYVLSTCVCVECVCVGSVWGVWGECAHVCVAQWLFLEQPWSLCDFVYGTLIRHVNIAPMYCCCVEDTCSARTYLCNVIGCKLEWVLTNQVCPLVHLFDHFLTFQLNSWQYSNMEPYLSWHGFHTWSHLCWAKDKVWLFSIVDFYYLSLVLMKIWR